MKDIVFLIKKIHFHHQKSTNKMEKHINTHIRKQNVHNRFHEELPAKIYVGLINLLFIYRIIPDEHKQVTNNKMYYIFHSSPKTLPFIE